MGFPSVTYTFANSTTSDATQVNQNFTDVINGISDGTKNINISALTAAGTTNLQGSITLGASSSNILTLNAALGSSISIQTTNTYDIGSDSLGLRSIYFGSGASAHSTRLIGASVSSAWTMTLPTTAGSSGNVLTTDGTGVTAWSVFQRSATDAQNLGITATVATNALTIGVTDSTGSALSGSDLANIVFRNATATTGTVSVVSPSSVSSLVVPSGATLGQTSGVNQYVWVYLLNNAGTAEIAVSGVNVFDNGSIQSTTAITSGSTSGSTLYSTSNRSNVAIRLIGRILVNEAAAGTWASAPTEITLNPLVVPKITDTSTSTYSFTPNSGAFGTIVNPSYSTRREGDTLQFKIQFTNGTAAAGTSSIAMPSGLTIKTGAYGTSLATVVGTVNLMAGTNGLWINGIGAVLFYDGSDASNLYIGFNAGSNTTITKATGSGNSSSGQSWEIIGSVAIAGWSVYGP